jgi:hypothetical protein
VVPLEGLVETVDERAAVGRLEILAPARHADGVREAVDLPLALREPLRDGVDRGEELPVLALRGPAPHLLERVEPAPREQVQQAPSPAPLQRPQDLGRVPEGELGPDHAVERVEALQVLEVGAPVPLVEARGPPTEPLDLADGLGVEGHRVGGATLDLEEMAGQVGEPEMGLRRPRLAAEGDRGLEVFAGLVELPQLREGGAQVVLAEGHGRMAAAVQTPLHRERLLIERESFLGAAEARQDLGQVDEAHGDVRMVAPVQAAPHREGFHEAGQGVLGSAEGHRAVAEQRQAPGDVRMVSLPELPVEPERLLDPRQGLGGSAESRQAARQAIEAPGDRDVTGGVEPLADREGRLEPLAGVVEAPERLEARPEVLEAHGHRLVTAAVEAPADRQGLLVMPERLAGASEGIEGVTEIAEALRHEGIVLPPREPPTHDERLLEAPPRVARAPERHHAVAQVVQAVSDRGVVGVPRETAPHGQRLLVEREGLSGLSHALVADREVRECGRHHRVIAVHPLPPGLQHGGEERKGLRVPSDLEQVGGEVAPGRLHDGVTAAAEAVEELETLAQGLERLLAPAEVPVGVPEPFEELADVRVVLAPASGPHPPQRIPPGREALPRAARGQVAVGDPGDHPRGRGRLPERLEEVPRLLEPGARRVVIAPGVERLPLPEERHRPGAARLGGGLFLRGGRRRQGREEDQRDGSSDASHGGPLGGPDAHPVVAPGALSMARARGRDQETEPISGKEDPASRLTWTAGKAIRGSGCPPGSATSGSRVAGAATVEPRWVVTDTERP